MGSIHHSYDKFPLGGYVVSNKDVKGHLHYEGFVRQDGAWYILRETVNSGEHTYEYAQGFGNYETSWAGRTGLNYQLFHETF